MSARTSSGRSGSDAGPVRVGIEAGTTRTFAIAFDWPGWCRSAKGEEAALETLASYRDRFAVVAHRAGRSLPQDPELAIEERMPGTATTDFGAPDKAFEADHESLTEDEVSRHLALLSAAWELFDETVAGAPTHLRKGPRGGGRDRDGVQRHVVEAERSYARVLGVRHKPFDTQDPDAREALRADLRSTLRAQALGELPTGKWPVRYAVQRLAWHVVDHLWEIEDKSEK